MKQIKAGANTFDWNGQDENGVSQPPGDYNLVIEAKDGVGQKIGVETQFDGVISGINFTGEGPLLLVGNRTVKFSDVRKIVDPSLKKDDQNLEKKQTPDLKTESQSKETGKVAPPNEQNLKTNMNQVGLSREMMNVIDKVAAKKQ
jgi:flagellar basal-body rod modification protein FlgD